MANLAVIDLFENLATIASQGFSTKHYSDVVYALNAIEVTPADIVFVDYSAREVETASYIQLILKTSPNSKVVLVGNGLADQIVIACLIAGAEGYIEKEHVETYLPKLVNVLMAGEVWISRRLTSLLLNTLRSQ